MLEKWQVRKVRQVGRVRQVWQVLQVEKWNEEER